MLLKLEHQLVLGWMYKKFNLTSTDFIVSYVGLLAMGRGIEVMLESEPNNDEDFYLLVWA